MNNIKLSIDEISELEHIRDLLKDYIEEFDFKDGISENEKEVEKLHPFNVYLVYKWSNELIKMLNEWVFDRYYDGKEIEIKRNAQRKYCDKGTSTPNFADFGTNSKGECLDCRENIWKHITLEKASTELITGCPCCSRSYCD